MSFCHNEDNVCDNGNNYNRENDLMDQRAIKYLLKDAVNSMLLTVVHFHSAKCLKQLDFSCMTINMIR